MSGTPEYYFAKRWHGIEKLGEFIGDMPINSKRSSIELSISEEISDVIEVIERFLHFSDVIKNALLEQKLSENNLRNEMRVLGQRLEWATNVLQGASTEINLELNKILLLYANEKTAGLNESERKDQKS